MVHTVHGTADESDTCVQTSEDETKGGGQETGHAMGGGHRPVEALQSRVPLAGPGRANRKAPVTAPLDLWANPLALLN